MPRGQPDYGMYASKTASASVSDMGEVASRLGSIDTYDKRGDVIYLDDFEAPVLKAEYDESVAGGSAILDSENVKTQAQSVKLTSPAGAGESCTLRFPVVVQAALQMGAEIHFSNLSTNCFLAWEIAWATGALFYLANIKLDPVANKLYYYDSTGAYQELDDIETPRQKPHLFHVLKLVADFDSGQYTRLQYDNREYDLTAYAMQVSALVVSPYIPCLLTLHNLGALAGEVWLDNFILTQAEP